MTPPSHEFWDRALVALLVLALVAVVGWFASQPPDDCSPRNDCWYDR